jgi:hypothetical protein
MEEWPNGKQHFIYPNLKATAKTVLLAPTGVTMPGGNHLCHVGKGNSEPHSQPSFQKQCKVGWEGIVSKRYSSR